MKHAWAAAGFAALALGLAAAPSFAKDAKAFLTDAMKTDNAEIQLGQLATQHGSSPDVKNYGQMLVKDHTQAKEQVSSLASSMGVTATDDVPPKAKAEYDKLQKLSGAGFDKEFVSFMIAGHKKAIAEFQAQSSASDAQTSALAKKQLPVLEKHLSMAQSLEKDSNGQ